MEEGLEDEIERHKEEDNTQEQVRMSSTMDGNDADANETWAACDRVRMSAMHLQTVRGVLRTAQCSRQCALWYSCNWSQCAQDCRCCA